VRQKWKKKGGVLFDRYQKAAYQFNSRSHHSSLFFGELGGEKSLATFQFRVSEKVVKERKKEFIRFMLDVRCHL
jgi:hypothetical protein